MYYVYDLTLRVLEGDIEAIITVLIPVGLMFWWVFHVFILPARQWKPPSGPKERTYFYRRRRLRGRKGGPGDRAGAKAVKRETPADRPKGVLAAGCW